VTAKRGILHIRSQVLAVDTEETLNGFGAGDTDGVHFKSRRVGRRYLVIAGFVDERWSTWRCLAAYCAWTNSTLLLQSRRERRGD
jgi:hypothetical protein